MVERSLSMREVPGSIPGASNNLFEISFCISQDHIRLNLIDNSLESINGVLRFK